MADEEEQEVNEEEENPLLLRPTEGFADLYNDQEKLVVTVIVSPRCPHCTGLLPFVNKMSKHEDFVNAKFMWIDADVYADAAKQLGVSSVPHTVYSLKGQPLESFSGSNTEKFEAHLRNTQAKRNEEMKEYDAEKKKAAEAAAAAAAAAEAPGDEEE